MPLIGHLCLNRGVFAVQSILFSCVGAPLLLGSRLFSACIFRCLLACSRDMAKAEVVTNVKRDVTQF